MTNPVRLAAASAAIAAAALLLDPFGGAGTTALVAARHGRDATLIELNPDYAVMAMHRIGAALPDCDIVMGDA